MRKACERSRSRCCTGVEAVLIHPLAGVLSAYGMGLANARVRERGVGVGVDRAGVEHAARGADALRAEVLAALTAQRLGLARVANQVRARRRYAGAEATLPIEFGPPETMAAAFAAAHRARFGFVAEDVALVIDSVVAEAIGFAEPAPSPAAPVGRERLPRLARARFAGEDRDTPLFDRTDLGASWRVDGPAIVSDASATTVVEPGWRARVDVLGNRILTRATPRARVPGGDTAVDPLRLELFANLFMAIAEDMGAALQATAASVNIKERLDFSCGVRPRRRADRQRAAPARASGLDGRQRPRGDRRRADASG